MSNFSWDSGGRYGSLMGNVTRTDLANRALLNSSAGRKMVSHTNCGAKIKKEALALQYDLEVIDAKIADKTRSERSRRKLKTKREYILKSIEDNKHWQEWYVETAKPIFEEYNQAVEKINKDFFGDDTDNYLQGVVYPTI